MPLTQIPTVVRSRLSEVDLFPRVLADVVDIEARSRGVRIEREPERVAQSPGVRFLAPLAGVGTPGLVAARAVPALKRIAARNPAGGSDPQNLAKQHMLVAAGIILCEATGRISVVAAAIAYADIQVAIFTKIEVPGVVEAAGREQVVEKHDFAARIDLVRGHREP